MLYQASKSHCGLSTALLWDSGQVFGPAPASPTAASSWCCRLNHAASCRKASGITSALAQPPLSDLITSTQPQPSPLLQSQDESQRYKVSCVGASPPLGSQGSCFPPAWAKGKR